MSREAFIVAKSLLDFDTLVGLTFEGNTVRPNICGYSAPKQVAKRRMLLTCITLVP